MKLITKMHNFRGECITLAHECNTDGYSEIALEFQHLITHINGVVHKIEDYGLEDWDDADQAENG